MAAPLVAAAQGPRCPYHAAMSEAPLPAPDAEARRLARLRELAVLDTGPEPLFDELVALAARLCGTPIALVSLVDDQRQWFKARLGLAASQTPRDQAFCAHAIQSPELFEVADALSDPRFVDNPLVQGEPHIRFYAGVPIELDDGSRPGTLCVIDRQPRALSESQRDSLRSLARAVSAALLQRERTLNQALAVRSQLERELADRAQALGEALQAQAESEGRFQVLSEHSPLGVYHTDAEGACLYTNPAWQRIYGLSLQESLGDGWTRSLHPDDAPAVFARWQEAAARGEPFEMGFRIRQPGGELRHVLSRARAIQGRDGEVLGYVGKVEDISARLAVERELAESRALLDHAGRIAGVGGWRFEVATQSLTWTDHTCRIHDLEPGHQPQLDEAIRYYAPEGRVAIEAAVQQALVTGEGWDLELPMITATGRHIWVRANGEAVVEAGVTVRLIGAFQDITLQHRARQELESSRERLRALYEATPAMLHSVDTQLRLLTVSDLWLQNLGYRREAVIGRSLLDFLAPDAMQASVGVNQPELWREGRVMNRPTRFVHGDGSVRDLLFSAIVEYDEHGAAQRALVFLDDITEDLRRQAELAREQGLRRQIERHAADLDQLLRERSEMLDVLAHEVRQPLNNASAALQSAGAALAAKGLITPAQQRLARAQSVLAQVQSNVDNTLAAAALLAGTGQIARGDTDIDTLIAVSITDLPREHRDRVVIERLTPTRTALMDMSLMRLALRNLLSNALKYSAPASVVWLRVQDCDEPLALVFEVIDAGSGFPPELRGRLFQRGARAGAAAEGTHGLGLYIVRRVMDLHGGSAELAASGPGGSVMRLTLPQSDE